MAVFTQVSLSELAPWLQKRGVAAHKCAAISEGIENTNYRICADDLRGNDGNDGFNNIARRRRDYVFTIFELWDMAQVRYYAALMQHFAACDLPIPAPVLRRNGGMMQSRVCLCRLWKMTAGATIRPPKNVARWAR